MWHPKKSITVSPTTTTPHSKRTLSTLHKLQGGDWIFPWGSFNKTKQWLDAAHAFRSEAIAGGSLLCLVAVAVMWCFHRSIYLQVTLKTKRFTNIGVQGSVFIGGSLTFLSCSSVMQQACINPQMEIFSNKYTTWVSFAGSYSCAQLFQDSTEL